MDSRDTAHYGTMTVPCYLIQVHATQVLQV